MDVYRALWRRRLLIAVLTIATVASTYVVVSRQTKIYQSTTLVRVQGRVADPTQVGAALGVAQHLAQTYAQIATTDAIANEVYTSLHGSVPRGHVQLSAQPVQDLELLYISAKSPKPKEAAAVANAAPKALRRFIARQPAAFRDEIEVVNPAGVSVVPVSPKLKTSVLIALIAGLVFNGALALLIEFLSDRMPGVEELEAATGKHVLATVPMLVFRSSVVERLEKRLGEELRPNEPATELARRVTRAEPRRTRG
jgi:polysaccharide biosynthesis transport protein